MAGATPTTIIRKRLSTFAHGFARPFSDTRRQAFVTQMIRGLVIGGHVHLTAVARAAPDPDSTLHATEKRLSRHLSSEHWDASPLAEELLRRSATMVTEDTIISADTTDWNKEYARHLEGLGRVHDGSDLQGRIVNGYCVFQAFVRVGHGQLFPLLLEPLKVYAGAPTGENAEILQNLLRVHEAVGTRGVWVLDRGFDRRELYGPLVKHGVAFVVRQRCDRTVTTADGRAMLLKDVVAEQRCPRPRRWPKGGVTVTLSVGLPEVSDQQFSLVIGWRYPDSERPLVLLVSPAARKPRRTGKWYVRAYGRRWGAEDATRGIKQQLELESFLVRSWRAIRRLLWLVGIAFWWLNLWGESSFDRLRTARLHHGWRLSKTIRYEFNWIARMLHYLLHPHPKLRSGTG